MLYYFVNILFYYFQVLKLKPIITENRIPLTKNIISHVSFQFYFNISY